jgi:hypothetical protein
MSGAVLLSRHKFVAFSGMTLRFHIHKFNTNMLHSAFYLLVNAPTCFGLMCWSSSGTSWVFLACAWLKFYGRNSYMWLKLILWSLNVTILNPLNAELNPICHMLVLLAHPILHISRIRVKSVLFYKGHSAVIWTQKQSIIVLSNTTKFSLKNPKRCNCVSKFISYLYAN